MKILQIISTGLLVQVCQAGHAKRNKNRPKHYKEFIGGKPKPEPIQVLKDSYQILKEFNFKIDWEYQSRSQNDLYFKKYENFLKYDRVNSESSDNDGDFQEIVRECPPKNWMSRFWQYAIAGDESKNLKKGFYKYTTIQEFDLAYKHCKLPCTGFRAASWEKDGLFGDPNTILLKPQEVVEAIAQRLKSGF